MHMGSGWMKNPGKTHNRIDSYINQWLSAWMIFLFLAMLGVIAVTAVMSGIYSSGIAHLQYVTERTGWHLDARMESVSVHLRNLCEAIDDLETNVSMRSDNPEEEAERIAARYNAMVATEEFDGGFHYRIEISTLMSDGGLGVFTASDAEADGFFDGFTGEISESKAGLPIVQEKSWKQVPMKEQSGSDAIWMTYAIRWENADGKGVLRVFIPLSDLTGWIRKDMDHHTSNWLLVSEDKRPVAGDISQLSKRPLDQAAWWLEANHDVLAQQKGYSQLRTDWFGTPAYVFRITLMSKWHYYCIVTADSLFGREILMIRLMGGGLGLVLLSSLIAGILFSRRVTRGLVRLTAQVAATMDGSAFQPVETPNTYEILTLSEAFGKALTNLEDKNRQLRQEIERNSRMSAEISRIQSHMRLFNENGFRIDMFDYLPEEGLVRVHTGLTTMYGPGSKICREMPLETLFANFEISPDVGVFLEQLEQAAAGDGTLDVELEATRIDGQRVRIRCRMQADRRIDAELKGLSGIREIAGVFVDLAMDGTKA